MSNSNQPAPTELVRQGDAILIKWSDGTETPWKIADLRKQCPCADCRDKHRTGGEESQPAKPLTLPILSAAEAQPLQIEAMRPVGSYAYNITFSDGHSAGIFTFDFLRKN